jgi:hypothetical protein
MQMHLQSSQESFLLKDERKDERYIQRDFYFVLFAVCQTLLSFLDSTIITTIRLSIPTRNGWTIRLKVCFTFIVGNIVAITENFGKYC